MSRHLRQILVSDHALLRWLERGHGIDIEFFRQTIRDRCQDAVLAGATQLITPEGRYLIRGTTVTTFLSRDMKPSRGAM